MPLTLAEYRIGQLYEVMEASKRNTGGGDGFEWVSSEPRFDFNASFRINFKEHFVQNHYTHKLLNISHGAPNFLRLLAPKGALELTEICFNAFPYIHTSYSSDYMKNNLYFTIDSVHLEDRGTTENAHHLDAAELANREVVVIDLASDAILSQDITPDTDPRTFTSEKTGRGPLKEGWVQSQTPVMCCYKLVRCEFKWFGLQEKVESMIMKLMYRIFGIIHREMFCFIDKWIDLTIEDIRKLENKTKFELLELKQAPEYKGILA